MEHISVSLDRIMKEQEEMQKEDCMQIEDSKTNELLQNLTKTMKG